MLIYDYIWLYMIVYDYICLYMMIYDDIWLYMIMYDYIWLYMMIYDYIWSCMIIYDYTWLYVILCDYIYSTPMLLLVVSPDAPASTTAGGTHLQEREQLTDGKAPRILGHVAMEWASPRTWKPSSCQGIIYSIGVRYQKLNSWLYMIIYIYIYVYIWYIYIHIYGMDM